jgi:hypothetical protein
MTAGWPRRTRTSPASPWEQADLIVNGGDSIPHDPDAEVVLAR